MIRNIKTKEILIKKEELNILTINLVNYQYMNIYKKLNLNDVVMDFDASSLYPSAMWVEKSVYPKIETGFGFRPHMNKTYVNAFNNQTFNQHGDESAILRIK